MVKVLYLFQTLGVGGAEQLLLTTLKYLNRKQINPLVYCIGENGQIGREIEDLGITVKALNKKICLWNVGIFWDLIVILKKEKPDILHTSLFYPNYFGRLAAICARTPVVIITEHGTYSNFKNFFHHGIDYILSLATTRIIAVSMAVREYLLKYTFIPKEKIAVIYNAIDFERFDEGYNSDKSLVRKGLGFEDSDILIGSVSNLAPWKGQYFLLQAFAEVVKIFPRTKLCVVGRDSGDFRNELDTYARKEGFRENVYFLGERRDIPQLMKSFDIFVLPSLTEGLGISLLEAMYMGLPAIASDSEGISEIIENGSDGFLVPTGNAQALAEKIIALVPDKEKLKQIGCRAREKIREGFLPANYLAQLEQVYNI